MRKNFVGIVSMVYACLMAAVLFVFILLPERYSVVAILVQILLTAGFISYLYKKTVIGKEEVKHES